MESEPTKKEVLDLLQSLLKALDMPGDLGGGLDELLRSIVNGEACKTYQNQYGVFVDSSTRQSNGRLSKRNAEPLLNILDNLPLWAIDLMEEEEE